MLTGLAPPVGCPYTSQYKLWHLDFSDVGSHWHAFAGWECAGGQGCSQQTTCWLEGATSLRAACLGCEAASVCSSVREGILPAGAAALRASVF